MTLKRRLTSLLIVWLTLFSVAVPAISCAAANQHHDCCPDPRTPPCGECPERAPGPGTPSHCLAAPASIASAAVVQDQTRKQLQPDLVPALTTAPPALAPQSVATEPIRQRWRPRDDFETPTYLVTGRLRL